LGIKGLVRFLFTSLPRTSNEFSLSLLFDSGIDPFLQLWHLSEDASIADIFEILDPFI
jgi:hypothetical protein